MEEPVRVLPFAGGPAIIVVAAEATTLERQWRIGRPRSPGDSAVAGDSYTGRVIDLFTAIARKHGPTDLAPAMAPAATGNVIALGSVRRRAADPEPSAFWLVPDDRPAPPAPAAEPWLAVFLAGSLAAHVGLGAIFNDEPAPLPSIGVVSISVELMVGTDVAAGGASTPSPSESADMIPSRDQSEDLAKPETSRDEVRRADPLSWVEQHAALQQAPPPAERLVPEPDKTAELPSASAPAPATAPETAKPREQPAEVETGSPPPRDAPRRAERNDRQNAASVAATTSSGIGRGASNADATYPGIVAARLARFKQYPTEARARGDQGSATVTFTLDGDGSVTHVALTKKTGIASLDRESQAMVRRAAPFPPTPTGGPMSFTVPVNFSLR